MQIISNLFKYIFPIKKEYEQIIKSIEVPICKNIQLNELNIVTLHNYSQNIRKAILILKYKKFAEIEEIFANQISEYIISELVSRNTWENISSIYITFVPAHKARVKQRGYDHMKHLAKRVQTKLFTTSYKVEDEVELFKRVRNTKPQYNLTKKERILNMKNAFALQKTPNKRSLIFVIDDICTTGTTLKEINRIVDNDNLDVIFITLAHKYF